MKNECSGVVSHHSQHVSEQPGPNKCRQNCGCCHLSPYKLHNPNSNPKGDLYHLVRLTSTCVHHIIDLLHIYMHQRVYKHKHLTVERSMMWPDTEVSSQVQEVTTK